MINNKIEKLCTISKSGNPKKRRKAIEKLFKLSNDRDKVIRKQAILALGRIRDESTVEQLIERLSDGESEIRKITVEAIGMFNDSKAIESIIKCLEDKDASVRLSSALVLGQIGDKKAVEPLIKLLGDTDVGVRKGALESLSKLGDKRAINPIIYQLEVNDVWDAAIAALDGLDDSAVDSLIKAYKNNELSSDTIVCASRALSELGNKWAIEPLLFLLNDLDADTVLHTVHTLGILGDKRAVKPLIKMLDSGLHFEQLIFIMEALGKLGDNRAVDSLIKMLNHEVKVVQKAAAAALGEVGDTKMVVDSLLPKLEHTNPHIRTTTINAIKKIINKTSCNGTCELFDVHALESIVRCLKDRKNKVIFGAKSALYDLGDKRVIGLLKNILNDEDEDVCEIAAELLEKLEE